MAKQNNQMELTINQLKHYLGTGLKGLATDGSVYELIGLTLEYGVFKNVKYSKVEGQIKDFKPFLRPLSDLHKEIVHKGEKIIPIVELAKIACIGIGYPIDNNYIKVDEYRFQNEPEYHTEEYLILYGAKWETGRLNSLVKNSQDALIIYPPCNALSGLNGSLHFQHRQFIHGGEYTHPVHHLDKILEKMQELNLDYMGLIKNGLAIDINTI